MTPDVARCRLIDTGRLLSQYTARANCPCLHHCYECSAMHSRDRLLVVFTEDPQMFLQLLKGETNGSS